MAIQPLAIPEVNSLSHEVIFAGDDVRLAGQIDYPDRPVPEHGFPLLFILPHACCTGRHGFIDHALIGQHAGFAVFRWDKRGTGRSASGGTGSTDVDALNAYRTAIHQADINPQQVVIWSQTDASLLLGENYDAFKAIQKPLGVILSGNMLDEEQILAIDAPIFCVTGERDWNLASRYATAVANKHQEHYQLGSSSYIAKHANRKLIDTRNNIFHSGAEVAVTNWLESVCQNSPSI